MELATISEISREMGVSTRTLRYYEQIGLIGSVKKEDYAYRTYDEATVVRLRQILVLRKLRIPLKQIGLILQGENTAEIIDAFQRNLAELDDEITALSTIRDIIGTFVARLKESIHQDIKLSLMDDSALLEAVDALTVQKIPLKAEKTAADLQDASGKLEKLSDRDVRIVYLPPMTVASFQYEGDDPEMRCNQAMDAFVRESNLTEVKPDLRHFGFNSPDPDETGHHGYEMWVSIPEDFPVPEPLAKKRFDGGLYAAHTIPFGAFEEWGLFYQWLGASKFMFCGSESSGRHNMWGCMEEHLNYINHAHLEDSEPEGMQLDLLIPVRPKFAASTKHPQERIVDTFKYNDMPVEVVEWDATIWCGKIGYAENAVDAPDVGRISDAFLAQDHAEINGRLETAANALIHLDFHTSERPSAAMFAFLVNTESQPDGFDVYRIPAGIYMRLALAEESAQALGVEPWSGGPPPEEWIASRLAPQFGYSQAFDLPVIEYYGYLHGSTDVANAFLYVPVVETAKTGD